MKKHVSGLIVLTILLTACSTSEVRTIDIYGINSFKYVVENSSERLVTGDSISVENQNYLILEGIEAKPGEQIKIVLHVISAMPPVAMSHNWLLLELGTDPAAFAQASGSARDNNYVAPDMEENVIVETGMVGGGSSKEVTFTVPSETGEYDYICTFPGHYIGGMRGTLIVGE